MRWTTLLGASAIAVAGTGVGVGAGACSQKETCADDPAAVGFFSDTPRPRLCPSDTLELRAGTLSAAAPSAPSPPASTTPSPPASTTPSPPASATPSASPSATVGPTARVQLAVVGRRESGAPHESAHVDVRLEAGELLELAPRGQACRSITSTWLECVLDYDGRATFEALPRDGLTGTQRVVARSGPQIKELLLAVGNVPPAATVQRGDKSLVVARSRPLSCSSQATTGCSVRTSRRLALKPTGTVTSATATTVTLGSVGPPGSVWLSPTQGCDGDVQRLEVSFAAGATVSSPFYLCTNGARTSAALHAASGDAGPVELELWGVPESFAPTRLADGGQTLVARDCFSQPLGGIQVAFPDGALGVTDDAGTVGLVRGPSSADAGVAPVRVVVEQPEVLGSRSECTLEVLP